MRQKKYYASVYELGDINAAETICEAMAKAACKTVTDLLEGKPFQYTPVETKEGQTSVPIIHKENKP